MKIKKSNILILLGLAIPVILAFKAVFLPGPLAWGDSHHIYKETLNEIIGAPQAWVNRENNFGGSNKVLWLYPLMLARSFLGSSMGLGDFLAIRLVFYFPAIILTFITPFLFARFIKLAKKSAFFVSLIYGLNTYFILLVDGGQLGVFLSYSFFPLNLLLLKKLVDNPKIKSFILATLSFLTLLLFDPRIALISLLTFGLWVLTEKFVGKSKFSFKNFLPFIPLFIFAFGISAYWISPFIFFGQKAVSIGVSKLQLLSLINPLFLFQPHWPGNLFGVVSPPPFYFVGIPVLILLSLLFSKEKRIYGFALLFLIFSFFTKGETPPLGGVYSWFIANIPFASAFRDSSKFFIPSILFAGVLIASLTQKIKSRLILGLIYIYLLLLVFPAISGKMNGVLAARPLNEEFRVLYEKINKEEGFFRTVWFPERHPLTFQTEEKSALDAKSLVFERPFASMNVGTFDLFNFMHNEQFLEWFDLLGIKYLVFSGDPRKASLKVEEQKNWNDLLALTATTPGLLKTDWETSLPVYEIPETKPRIFAVDKIIAVVGGDDIYEKLSIGDQGIVFFEDGKFDPRKLDGVSSESAVLILNNKEEIDLTMSFLQKYFVGADKAEKSDWAFYQPENYLDWKYQLLVRDIDTKEFDYGKGIAFSTQTDEKLQIGLKASKQGDYILAVRSMASLQDGGLKADFNGELSEILNKQEGRFEWFIKPVSLNEGTYELTLENPEGFNIVNIVALIPKSDWDEAQQLTKKLISHFDSLDMDNLVSLEGKSQWTEVNFEKISPVRYKIALPEAGKWIVFSDSYHPEWKLKKGMEYFDSYPFYSMINGFYVDSLGEAEIVFEGQKDLRLGFYISGGAVLVLVFASFFVLLRRKRP